MSRCPLDAVLRANLMQERAVLVDRLRCKSELDEVMSHYEEARDVETDDRGGGQPTEQ